MALHAAFETGGLEFLLGKIGSKDIDDKDLNWLDEEQANLVTIENELG